MNFRNRYSVLKETEKDRKQFKKELTDERLTDQSQLERASITEMAKKFGIDALMAKAEQNYINEDLQNKLYGIDYTKMFTSMDELLKTKKKLNRVFEQIPARIRKEEFHDNVAEFVTAYTSSDENRLERLNKYGIISDSQLNNVKTRNNNIRAEREEAAKKEEFIRKLEEQKAGLYEKFKTTGTIETTVQPEQ